MLIAYTMKLKAGYDYLSTAAHFAAELFRDTDATVCTTNDCTKSMHAFVYHIDPASEKMKIAQLPNPAD